MAVSKVNIQPQVHSTLGDTTSLDYFPELDGLGVLVVDDEADARDLLECVDALRLVARHRCRQSAADTFRL